MPNKVSRPTVKRSAPRKIVPAVAAPTPPAQQAVLQGIPDVGGKLGLIVALLLRPEGADVSDMMEATGWQQHSVRGALAGALKRDRGFEIVSEKTDQTRIYRIVGASPQSTPTTPVETPKAPKTSTRTKTKPPAAALPKPVTAPRTPAAKHQPYRPNPALFRRG